MTGAGVIPIVPTFVDLAAPATFQGLVDHDIHAASRLAKGLDDEPKHVPARLQWRPAGSVEHVVKAAEIRVLFMTGLPQRGRHRAAAAREERSPQEGQQFLPGWGSK